MTLQCCNHPNIDILYSRQFDPSFKYYKIPFLTFQILSIGFNLTGNSYTIAWYNLVDATICEYETTYPNSSNTVVSISNAHYMDVLYPIENAETKTLDEIFTDIKLLTLFS